MLKSVGKWIIETTHWHKYVQIPENQIVFVTFC